jgi:hypothetical protein
MATPRPQAGFGSLKRMRLPNGSVTSMTRAFHGGSSMPGR